VYGVGGGESDLFLLEFDEGVGGDEFGNGSDPLLVQFRIQLESDSSTDGAALVRVEPSEERGDVFGRGSVLER